MTVTVTVTDMIKYRDAIASKNLGAESELPNCSKDDNSDQHLQIMMTN